MECILRCTPRKSKHKESVAHPSRSTQQALQGRSSARTFANSYYAGSENILREVQEKLCGYPPITTTAHDKVCGGKPNPEVDEPFMRVELLAALSTLTRDTSPGKDRIINKHLWNLSPRSLLKYVNECWESGEIPASWKH
ncbi:hypothetical protein HPB50_001006 [Hyalomma asiaticum]|uniref:Uncharacterized protein n=1 Tax=Hyalomma asiaticum TaxID=266040 RepID=A0ACB7SL79_HYAAI|nr:hypothetical protein HPB50_001006 [Hyalomma asiaticum]